MKTHLLTLCLFAGCADRAAPVAVDAADSRHGRGAEHAHEAPVAKPSTRGGKVLQLGDDALRDLRLTTRKVERRPAGDTLTALGSLEFDPDGIHAVSTPIAARVKRSLKRVGDVVAAGEPLLELESLDLGRARAALAAARARIAVARTRAELAEKQRDKVRELAADRMTTLREVQAAEAEQGSRAAELAESEIALRDAERTLSLLPAGGDGSSDAEFVLRAPVSGAVVFRDAVPGETVEAGHTFYRTADLSTLQAVIHPFERDGVRVDASATVRLSTSAQPGTTFAATFLRSGPEIDRESRTLPVRLAVPNPEGRLLAGMSVTAEIRIAGPAGQEILAVPIAAVQRVERDWCVFIPLGGGEFERRVVARGRDLGGEIEILAGLAADEEIVVEGAFVLRSESVRGADTGAEHEH